MSAEVPVPPDVQAVTSAGRRGAARGAREARDAGEKVQVGAENNAMKDFFRRFVPRETFPHTLYYLLGG